MSLKIQLILFETKYEIFLKLYLSGHILENHLLTHQDESLESIPSSYYVLSIELFHILFMKILTNKWNR